MIRAAEVTAGRPGRDEVFAAHLGPAVPARRRPHRRRLRRRRGDARVHGPGVRRLAVRVAGRVTLRDPHVPSRCLPDALACFREPGLGSRLPAAAQIAALPVLPDQDAVFAALRARADGEVVRALAALTTPGLARRAGDPLYGSTSPGAPRTHRTPPSSWPGGSHRARPRPPFCAHSSWTCSGAPSGVRAAPAAVLAAPGGEARPRCGANWPTYSCARKTIRRCSTPFSGPSRQGPHGARRSLRGNGCAAPGGSCSGPGWAGGLRTADGGAGPVPAGLRRTGGSLGGDGGGGGRGPAGAGARRTVETLGRAAPDVT